MPEPTSDDGKNRSNPSPAEAMRSRSRGRLAIIKGQDYGRWTDFYHDVLTAPWWQFLLGLAAAFVGINALFGTLYLLHPGGIANARPGVFADAFFFSVQTFGSIGYGVLAPKSAAVNILVTIESFTAVVYVAIATGLVYARFSRPFARVLFSDVAVVTTFDGTPTLMFRAANQRGNQILDASITVSVARQSVTREGHVMRRFDELKLVRARTPLFALSWTIMHRIDETSPLYGQTTDTLLADQIELIALLRGTDDTLSETIFARYAYAPRHILWDRHFVDVLSMTERGRRVVDLTRFHDTEADITSGP